MRTFIYLVTIVWFGVVWCGVVALPCSGQTVLQSKSQQLRSEIESYLGPFESGKSPLTSLIAGGQSYFVKLNWANIAFLQNLFGTTFTWQSEGELAPAADGTWQWDSVGPYLRQIAASGLKIDEKSSTYSASYTFDPEVKWIISGQDHLANYESALQVQGNEIRFRVDLVQDYVSSRPLESGQLDFGLSGALNELKAQWVNPQWVNAGINFETEIAKYSLRFDALNSGSLIDLLHFFANHPQGDEILAESNQLEAILNNLLPIFSHFSLNNSFEHPNWQGESMELGAAAMHIHAEGDGIRDPAAVHFSTDVSEITARRLFSKALLQLCPQKLNLDIEVQGLDLETALLKAIGSLLPTSSDRALGFKETFLANALGEEFVLRIRELDLKASGYSVTANGDIHPTHEGYEGEFAIVVTGYKAISSAFLQSDDRLDQKISQQFFFYGVPTDSNDRSSVNLLVHYDRVQGFTYTVTRL